MARPSNRRNETAPFTVRLSPAERAALKQKAAQAGVRASDAARAAIEAWEPCAQRQSERRADAEFAGGE